MKERVLVVDNHPLIQQFMSNLLKQRGYDVLIAKDGLAALEILKDRIPNIIFVDLVMPNIDGKKLCRIIRETPRLRGMKVIVMSAVAAEDDFPRIELGADAYIAKGPLNEMGKHVFAALDQLDTKKSTGPLKEVVGREDIHSRQITRELLSNIEHFETILASMSEGILEITTDGRVVYASPAALSLINVPEASLLASNFLDLFPEDDRKRINAILDVTKKEPQVIGTDLPVDFDGKQLELKILPLREKGQTTIVILNDISDQKRREAWLKQAQKMEAIGTLAAGIAHDFNNLLMGMQGYASLMLMQIDSTHPHYEMLKGIEKQVRSGSELTRQLLGYARKGKYEVRPVDLNQLVKETSKTFARTRKDVSVHRELAQGLFAIEADQDQIEQILFNLYVNAADAMLGGGKLLLKTMNTTHEDMSGKLYDPKPGIYVLLTVADAGTGMEKETMQHIFDPFFTTKEMGRGTGLGLASVYGIVKAHGGYIEVDSRIGHGSTFRIYLPAIEAEREETRFEPKKHEVVSGSTETVLLVDDEEMVREVGQMMLEAMGHKVLIAGNGEEAVRVYEKNRESIRIVLLDMIMPGMGGGKTYDRLKKINKNVRVILSSGYTIDGEATRILERGCDGFIQKPFSVEELSKKLREVLNKKS